MRVVFLTHPNIPGVGFPDVQAHSVGPDGNAHAYIAVPDQHSFEKSGGRQIALDEMAARDFRALQFGRTRARVE